ncbi:MAG: alpha/beta fold hydrolase [Acidimicrobiia bacterium]|nr:alpha/beta fold hydrolase [Acidimicrobiia bacterium]
MGNADDAPLLVTLRRDVERSLLRARNGLKYLAGLDRPTVGATPKDMVWQRGKTRLWRYRSDDVRYAPPVVLVHSLISRSYILDLRPGNSLVEFLRGRGFDVFLVDWGVPDETDAANTLETYVDQHLPAAIEQVVAVSGREAVTLVGYCLGGILAALAVAGHADLPVRNLATIAAPVDFDRFGGMFALFRSGRLDPRDVIDDSGNVPPEVLLNFFRVLKPTMPLVNYANLWQNLWNDEFLDGYQAMGQWTHDHIPFPGRCFEQVVDLFSHRNVLVEGVVPLGGRRVSLAEVTCPVLSVVAERDHIVPVEAGAPLAAVTGSTDVEEVRIPAGHVALMAGRQAAKVTHPRISDWLERHSS